MAPLPTGKRKRREELSDQNSNQLWETDEESRSPNNDVDDIEKLQALLRKHFEARFAPLEGEPSLPASKRNDTDRIDMKKHKQVEPESESEFESEAGWEGISDDEEEGEKKVAANVIEHQFTEARTSGNLLNGEFKSFMSSKPPSSNAQIAATNRIPTETTDPDEAAAEEANLKNDIALQRLLRESHLLDPQSTNLSLSVQNRHKALDLRLQEVGSKSSIHAQQNMPMAQRKGIAQKARIKEKHRREEAKQNGIILEVATKRKSKKDGKRQRSIGNPSVGRFQNGMLKLSKRDVAKIEGPKRRRKK